MHHKGLYQVTKKALYKATSSLLCIKVYTIPAIFSYFVNNGYWGNVKLVLVTPTTIDFGMCNHY